MKDVRLRYNYHIDQNLDGTPDVFIVCVRIPEIA